MSNELNNIIGHHTNGVYEGVAIGAFSTMLLCCYATMILYYEGVAIGANP